ncbi:alpha/beta fold hydrolase [Acetobacter persici]|uniref:Alpha/beta hydrolase n=1 Tax=Acetobacter persici TaxID=1076596 RepID=A0A6V8I733_9PROT|nr:alpha/beta hydrolase [Acetobacter persici]OUI91754.1 hypothetical protein HK19_04035 [Acetobacter persici]GFE92416.1 alpha/beta hydrolase [Acetobacter persici]
MTAPQLLFVHGWGFGPDVWNPVLKALGQPEVCLPDLGYFGASQHEAQRQVEALRSGPRPVLAVGHSLGFLWLLARGNWPEGSRFVGINAFGRFAAGEEFSQGISPRVLTRMQAGLMQNPAQVVMDFRIRCGAEPASSEMVCQKTLLEGLTDLRTLDMRPALSRLAGVPGAVSILAGGQDHIVSPDMTRASLPPDLPISWQAEGGHMLPQTHPDICAEAIRRMTLQMLENS